MFSLTTRGNPVKVFGDIADAAGFAGIVALTRTGQAVKAALTTEMGRVFDRPTRYTLNSLRLQPATKARPDATVWLRDDWAKGTPAERYLLPQIRGGARADKRSEKLLRQAGVLPLGMQAVPGVGARLDANGNMNRGQIVAILSYLRAFNSAGFTANRSLDPAAKRRGKWRRHDWFVISRGGGNLPPGVYLTDARSGRAVPVLSFVRQPSYRARFDFFGVARSTAAATLPRELVRALAEGHGRPRA